MAHTRNDHARKHYRRISALYRLERSAKFKAGDPRAIAEAMTLRARVS